MSTSVQTRPLASRPVAVEAGRRVDPVVAAVVVTWNRRAAVDSVVKAVSRQDYPLDRIHVAVIDNGSTDGTAEFLRERWSPEALIDNPTNAADRPAFAPVAGAPGVNRAGLGSLTIIRNARNLGGCGGFNTGLAWVERYADAPDRETRPTFVWFIDDDADLPPGALGRLVSTASSDDAIGLVGSRTVDFDDRARTLESTIYFDAAEGVMTPTPPPGHPMEESHRAWVQTTGGTSGVREFRGTRDVDIVPATSLLSRWEAVRRVGFWDRRYFIYCDDADWCLRFRRAGYRVVCDLEAVAYHTYWLSKLTPVREYYAQRNLLWMSRKVMGREDLRRITPRRFGAILLASRQAATHCRLFHAEIMRRTVHDVITNRGGRLDDEGPKATPLIEALDSIRAIRPDAEILVMCSHVDSIEWADDLRARVTHALMDAGRLADQPAWTYMVRDPGPRDTGAPHQPRRVVFTLGRRSKLTAQLRYLVRPPAATIVFNQDNDFPMIRSRFNVHIDRRRPDAAQVERDGFVPRLAFAFRWAWTSVRGAIHALLVRPAPTGGKYG